MGRAADRGRGDGHVRDELGRAYQHSRRFPKAIGAYQKATGLRGDVAEIHNGLGVAMAQSGDIGGALREFSRALELKPDYAEAKANLDRASGMRRQWPTVQGTQIIGNREKRFFSVFRQIPGQTASSP